MLVDYLTSEGKRISYMVEGSLSVKDIDRICNLYITETDRFPEKIFMRKDTYAQFIRDIAMTESSSFLHGENSRQIKLYLSAATLPVICVNCLESLVVVGNEAEYRESLIGKLFEDIILNG